MKKQINPNVKAHLIRGAFYLLLLLAVCVIPFALGQRRARAGSISQRTVTFTERVAYQRAIEEVYWRHRIWPKERPDPKPRLDAVMSQAQIEKKVENYLRSSQTLEDYWHRPITAEQLQAEMDRMAKHTKQPDVLHELFEALGNDPFVIAECLARPVLAERTLATVASVKESRVAKPETQVPLKMAAASANYTLPVIASPSGTCTNDTWTPTSTTNVPDPRVIPTAVWTGSEMIVWGGGANGVYLNTGGRYNPSTDTWTATTTVNAPSARIDHTAVWTGSEMIVWGGTDGVPHKLGTGGRYNPVTDTWIATSTTNAPDARRYHQAVWTGSEMIVWGGEDPNGYLNTGGRYNPNTDSWTATSTTNAPYGREECTAVWTGSEMIIWGGHQGGAYLNTGGRYNPSSDTWTATSLTNAPDGRFSHTAVWTGSEMIVWGGTGAGFPAGFNTGGRYNPSTDSWTATGTNNSPEGRFSHTAVWTGTEMIVWGGIDNNLYLNTGGRYNPSTDTWIATTTTGAPQARADHVAVWTGTEMIVWGGNACSGDLRIGYRYCAGIPGPTPTATPTPTPGGPCIDDTWAATSTVNAPDARDGHTAVWTGSEMIIWGGENSSYVPLNTGARYDPTTDSWTVTSTINAPDARSSHTAVWTGNEMIVWGGFNSPSETNTGGKYNPTADVWTATSTTNAPLARQSHTAVWTGSEMIVWGGYGCGGNCNLNSGGRYDPSSDSWTGTSTTNAPEARWVHTAVWTGSDMIIWGGTNDTMYLNTGGRYNPGSNGWTATSTTNVPTGRIAHTAVWSGSEMIVWGGASINNDLNTGGRYNPSTDAWTATSLADAPSPRDSHTAVWTGSQMIVWSGYGSVSACEGGSSDGGRYEPITDSWTPTSTANAPVAREYHTAVWTGSQMIVWGGYDYIHTHLFNTGGRYCAQAPPTPTPTPTATASPTPTPTATSTPTPTPTATPTATATATPSATVPPSPTPTPTARPTPIPRPRPTPVPRP
jgi:N-acetylneuraminic acid mutarotase